MLRSENYAHLYSHGDTSNTEVWIIPQTVPFCLYKIGKSKLEDIGCFADKSSIYKCTLSEYP